MKQVNSKIYDKAYYLKTCLGAEEFIKTGGQTLHPRVTYLLNKLPINKSMTILDIGCGRGDITFQLSKKAKKTIGIDYSLDAIQLANDIKKHFPKSLSQKTSFFVMDAKKLQVETNSIDVITCIDVFEHLHRNELEIVMAEIQRVLKPGGILFVHTGTNKVLYEYTYKFYIYPINKLITNIDQLFKHTSYNSLPKDPRTNAEKQQHVNEPTYFYLKKLFKKYNFSGEIEIEIGYIKDGSGKRTKLYNLLVSFYPISKHFPLNLLFGWVFICIMRKQTKSK